MLVEYPSARSYEARRVESGHVIGPFDTIRDQSQGVRVEVMCDEVSEGQLLKLCMTLGGESIFEAESLPSGKSGYFPQAPFLTKNVP